MISLYAVEGRDWMPIMSVDNIELAKDLLNSFKPLEKGYAHLVHLGDNVSCAVEVHSLIMNSINPIVRIKIAATSEDVHFVANFCQLLRKIRDMGSYTPTFTEYKLSQENMPILIVSLNGGKLISTVCYLHLILKPAILNSDASLC